MRRPLLHSSTFDGAHQPPKDSDSSSHNDRQIAARTWKTPKLMMQLATISPTERTPLVFESPEVNDTAFRPASKHIPWHERTCISNIIYAHCLTCWIILRSNYANVLLLLLPLAYARQALHWPSEVVLVLNGLPMLPLTILMALSTEESSAKIGPSFAALMAYSFGNVGTIITSCALIKRGEILVVQTSLLGAIVFNLLAVVGCQYVASGIKRGGSRVTKTVASVHGSALLLAMANVALPAVLRRVQDEDSVVRVSRGLAVMLIMVYVTMLVFRFRSHCHWWEREVQDLDEYGENILAPIPALVLLIAATTSLTLNTEFFVDTLDNVTSHHDVSRTFVGFIFLPLFSNALSHFTDIGDAYQDKMDEAANAAFGCSLQILLFILPLSVLVGWALRQDMTMNFDIFLNASAFTAVLLVNSVTQNGKSNYFEGCLLLNCYIGIAVAAFFYPAGVGDGHGRS